MMTKIQAEHLAAIVHELRDDWGIRGILAAILPVRDRPLADVCAAAIRAAQTPTNRNPAVIPLDGPHWQRTNTSDTTWTPPRRTEECPTHQGGRQGHCAGCRADQLATTTEETR